MIRDAIVDGRLEPGRRLKEEELARELGISRTPVREALLVLQTEGLLDVAPNRGATVRAYAAEDLDDLYQLRAVLEGFAARRAATRDLATTTSRAARELRALRRRSARRRRRDRARPGERPLPRHHPRGRGERPARGDGASVIELPLVYRSFVWYSPEQKLISEHYHRQLTARSQRRDAERAELVMKEHVLEARDLLVAKGASWEAA